MAVIDLYNAAILVNAVDLSNKCRKVRVQFGQEKKETTAFGNTARTYIYGLATPMCEAEFYLDRASGSVVQTLRGLLGVGTSAFALNVRASNSAATTSNEVYTMNAVIDGGIDVINGAIGDVETTTVKFACASATGWATATTS